MIVFKQTIQRVVTGTLSVVMAVSLTCTMPAAAFFTGCAASISPVSSGGGMVVTYDVQITNNAINPMRWIQISVPGSGNYTYSSHTIGNGWTITEQSKGVTGTGSSINSGATESFPVEAVSVAAQSGEESWTVRASTDPSGANFSACTGTYKTSILTHMPTDTNNGVSGIAVSSIGTSSAQISWQSDNPTSSVVYYGLDGNYGNRTEYEGTLVTDHSVALSGLSPSTTYHFQVAGYDGVSGFAWSTDNTFITADVPTGGGNSGGGGNNNGGSTSGNNNGGANNSTTNSSQNQNGGARSGDTTAPVITLGSTLSGTYKTAPIVSGSVSDNQTVATVEYSTDAGNNWLKVQSAQGLGGRTASFSFTPTVTADGNYSVIVRATDQAGNQALSKTMKLVIDKSPPIVAGNSMFVGPQTLASDGDTPAKALIGTDLKITTTASGGATSITIDAIPNANKKLAQSFSLRSIPDSRLWTGALNFSRPGNYQLVARAIDGAGNRTERTLNSVVVNERQKITDVKSTQPVRATITVYCRDPETGTWVKWDSASYDQPNPVLTNPSGEYGLYLPSGTYYLAVSSAGYKQLTTRSFSVDEPTIVSSPLQMSTRPTLRLGPIKWQLPWMSLARTKINLDQKATNASTTKSSGLRAVPTFTLPVSSAAGQTFKSNNLYGKPSVVTFVSTWAAPAQDQLSILNDFADEAKDTNVLAINSGESWARVAVNAKIARYAVTTLVDADGKVTSQFGAATLPTTYVLDRSGNVKKTVTGVVSKQQLQDYVLAAR